MQPLAVMRRYRLVAAIDSARTTLLPAGRRVRAEFLPQPDPEFGHDPHCVRFAGGNPDRLYQQNHCGIYRLDRPSDT
ncbi:MAG TPA: hypothetical protein VFM98_23530, partial [Ramlibacter sp.]|nr:hypothetical protein [Ramlibacter sp.]